MSSLSGVAATSLMALARVRTASAAGLASEDAPSAKAAKLAAVKSKVRCAHASVTAARPRHPFSRVDPTLPLAATYQTVLTLLSTTGVVRRRGVPRSGALSPGLRLVS